MYWRGNGFDYPGSTANTLTTNLNWDHIRDLYKISKLNLLIRFTITLVLALIPVSIPTIILYHIISYHIISRAPSSLISVHSFSPSGKKRTHNGKEMKKIINMKMMTLVCHVWFLLLYFYCRLCMFPGSYCMLLVYSYHMYNLN